MRIGWFLIVCALTLGLTAACSSLSGRCTEQDVDFVTAYMTGSFDSAAHAAADADYKDVRLHMTPIWTARTDGHWLYVEQALASALDKPYRVRVYHVHLGDGDVVSDVFTLPGDAVNYAGAWRDAELLKGLAPESLTPREGCSIHLHRTASGTYTGSTVGDGCKSELRGATHATSEVTVFDNMLLSWDRGFDASGKQVWGAEKGPYQFLKSN